MAHLVIVDGRGAGESVHLDHGTMVLGRDADAEIVLSSPAVSRRHCAFESSGKGVELSDLGTTNGTRVNGRPVARARLVDGDEISVGDCVLLFVDDEEGSSALVIEGHTLLADAGPAPRWRAQQLDELLALGESLSKAGDARGILELLADWLESTLFVSSVGVRRRNGARWTTVFERGQLGLGAEGEAEARRSAARGDLRWVEAIATLFAPLPGAPHAYVAVARVAAGDPHPTEWELRLAACACRLAGAALSTPVRRALDHDLPRLNATQSDAMRAAIDILERATGTDATVLVRGESGTGKELAARWLHDRGARALQPFVAVNCGALPETLLESELFGHEAGAFTGATSRHAGRFERAHRGTLFLDEIGELSPGAQARLLRVLETRTIERVGGTESLRVDVRIVAATHRDLEAMCARGEFREDLYYRLAVLTVRLPALRERVEDIPALATSFLHEASKEHGRPRAGFDDEALAALCSHRWPGNIRQLKNAVAHACLVAHAQTIGVHDLPTHVVARSTEPTDRSLAPRSLREVEEAAVRAALASADGNKSKAARVLGINRATLYAKLELYEIPS